MNVSRGSKSFFMRTLVSGFLAALLVTGAQPAWAGGGLPQTIDWYSIILHSVGLGHEWVPTLGSLVILGVIVVMGLRYRSQVAMAGDDVTPDGRFGLRYLIDTVMDTGYQLTKENCGELFNKLLPFMCGLLFFILIANLSGLVPGFPAPTATIDMNLAMGLSVFIVYNAAGIKEHGSGYIKHFLGPVWWIAPLFFVIELISHGSRPLSLSIRLLGNLFGDHTLLGVFTGLTYVVFPALLMFFGLLVAVVQSFVFTLLTGIYISMAISHDH